MIVPPRTAFPVILLTALVAATLFYNAGIAAAPRGFFGTTDDVVLILPGTGQITSGGSVPEDIVAILRKRDDVLAVSPEIVVLSSLGDQSVMARGVDAESFLAIEQGTIVAGVPPRSPLEAIIGEQLARRLGIAPGDRIALAGSIFEAAAPVTMVGIFRTGGLPDDEILLDLQLARGLAALPPGTVHFIRAQSEDAKALSALVSSVEPSFSFSDVKISSEVVLAGRPVIVTGELTNWGLMGGHHEVVVYVDDLPVTRTNVYVPARSTVPLRVPVVASEPGESVIRLNPTLSVSVKEPLARLLDVPRVVPVATPVVVRVVDLEGGAWSGVRLTAAGEVGWTDEEGRASLLVTRTGRTTLEAYDGTLPIAALDLFVTPPGHENLPFGEVLSAKLNGSLFSRGETASLRVELANAGGAAGDVAVPIFVDGEEVSHATAVLASGATTSLDVELPVLGPGLHSIRVGDLPGPLALEVIDGDARLEEAIRAREYARSNPSAAPRVGPSAEAYVERIVRSAAIAATALVIAASSLATLSLVVVWTRHLAERAPAIGVLKALGADKARIRTIATIEAVRVLVPAVAAGVLLGAGIAIGLHRTGTVRAFGHRIEPVTDLWIAAALGLCAVLANAWIVSAIVGRLYDESAGALISRQAPESSEALAPSLAQALTEARD